MKTSNLLRGSRVRLTTLAEADLPSLAAWYEDVEFARLFDALPALPKPLQEWREWLDKQHKAQDAFVLSIRRLEDDAFLGYVELDGILWAHGTAWLSIAIGDHAHWGQGYGTEALQLTLAFTFRELNLYRIQATVFDYNVRSQALFERAGFRHEGSFRDFLQRDGKRHAMLLYGLLRPEWDAMHSEEG